MAVTFHTLVALHIPKKHGDFLIYANHILDSLTQNAATFPNPTPPLATFKTHIQAYETAETGAASRTVGSASERDLELHQVVTDIHQIGAYVQTIADGKPSRAESVAVIDLAGFGTHKQGVHQRPDLLVRMGPGGLVLLRAHALGKRVAYEWQMSSDGGKTWTSLPSTNAANTSVAGLSAGTTYVFRFRGNVGSQPGDWHDPVPFLVH